MREKLNLPLTVEGKNSKNKKSRKGKMFGYQVLGFGSGGGATSATVDYLIIAGGGGGGGGIGGGGGAGGFRTSADSATLDLPLATPITDETPI